MEQQILTHEKFIKKAAKHPTPELAKYHQIMIQNFQHERLIHLIITLFFCALSLIMLGACYWLSTCFFTIWWSFLPLDLATLLLIGLSIAYVRHYYFLENHLQRFYDYTRKLHKLDNL